MYVSFTTVARAGNQGDLFVDSWKIKSEVELLIYLETFSQS